MSALNLRRRLAAGLLAGVGIAALLGASPAASQTAVTVTLTHEELQVLREIVACRKEPTPENCSLLQRWVNGVPVATAKAQPAPQPVAVVQEAAAPAVLSTPTQKAAEVIRTSAEARTKRGKPAVQGHGPRPEGQTGDDDESATVAFSAATDTKNASLTLSFDLGPISNGDPHTLSIVAQTPVGQDEDYTNVATQDGMTKASSIGLEYSRLFVKLTGEPEKVLKSPEYMRACGQLLSDFKSADPNTKIPAHLTAEYGCHAHEVLGLISGSGALTDDVKKRLEARAEVLVQQANPKVEHVWMLTGGGKVGYEKHKFYDPNTLAKLEVDRTPWELSGAATYVFGGGLHSTTLGYKFQRIYKDGGDDGEAKVLCQPTGSPFLPCVSGFIDRPLREKQHLFSLDYRYIAPKGPFGIPMGFNPTATYDAQSGEYGFQLPVYVIVDKAKYLTGGVRWDWTSEKHESTFGIFVTSAFCVLPNFSGCTNKKE